MKTIRNLIWFAAGAAAAAAAAYIVVEVQNQDEEWNDAWDVSQKPISGLINDDQANDQNNGLSNQPSSF